MYAMKFGDSNFLLSGRVGPDSKVLYYRNPVQRVEKVAPWLTLDSDVYPAVVDGRILWIVDGYTTTDRYPQAERDSYHEMTTDSLTQPSGVRTLPTDQINYMRNAVKATVDAYSGKVTLYAWDDTDPMLQAWRNAVRRPARSDTGRRTRSPTAARPRRSTPARSSSTAAPSTRPPERSAATVSAGPTRRSG